MRLDIDRAGVGLLPQGACLAQPCLSTSSQFVTT